MRGSGVGIIETASGLKKERLWRVRFVMLSGLALVRQAAFGNCLPDPFPFDRNGLALPEGDVCRRQLADGLIIAQGVVFGGERRDPGFAIARQIIMTLCLRRSKFALCRIQIWRCVVAS